MAFDFTENVIVELPDVSTHFHNLEEAVRDKKKVYITEVAAIHAGLTANFNNYSAAELEKAINSWVQPYPKPIIINHDLMTDPLGRVMAARMDKESDGTPYQRIQIAITNPGAIERAEDKRYLTGSVGGKAEKALCSICNIDWAAKENYKSGRPCRHVVGQVYNGKLAYYELIGIQFKEYSFVNLPADTRSGIRGTSDTSIEDSDSETTWVRAAKVYELDMDNEIIIELTESGPSKNILEDMDKKKAQFTYRNLKGTFLTVSALDFNENVNEIITFNQNNTTIDDELESDSSISSPDTNGEQKMAVNEEVTEQEEDLLSVTEELSADLASQADATEGDSDEVTEDSNEEINDEGSANEEDNSEVVEEQLTEEENSVDAEEHAEESQDAEDEVTEGVTEDASDDLDSQESDEASVEETATSEDATSEEADIESLKEENEKLKEQNARYKNALHKMLAERVVDTKIALGYIAGTDRTAQVEEHVSRTASSLADSLRDLSVLPAVARETGRVPEMQSELAPIEEDNSTIEAEESAPRAKEVPLEKQLEDKLVDRLMNRVKF